MRKILFIALLLLFQFSLQTFSQQAWIMPSLQNALQEKQGEYLKVNIIMKEQVDLEALKMSFEVNQTPVDQRAKTVISTLINQAEASQKDIKNFLNNAEGVKKIQCLWIANMMIIEAKTTVIEELAQRSDIEYMELTSTNKVKLIKPVEMSDGAPKSPNGIEPGLAAINAPALWAMGYTGLGRKLYSVDTGVWPSHPAINNGWLGNYLPLAEAWYPFDSPLPVDKANSHGTHTIGTVLGLDPANNDTIGVAFNAYFMATDPIVTNEADIKPLSEIALGFEFALNPDGDTSTVSDLPDVINNSWGHVWDTVDYACVSYFQQVTDAVAAAGIANVYSAGNEGPDSSTVGDPANISTGLVTVFSVGALSPHDPAFPIAGFSSRGPGHCGGTGSILIKPEVAAPGVNIRSCVDTDAYSNYSGTSMAAPHTSGAVLLLKEAFPYLSGEEIMEALYFSALDLGDPGEDNTYGMGMIDVLAAFNYLSQTHTPVPPASRDWDIAIENILDPVGGFTCNNVLQPEVMVVNRGDSTITAFDVFYQLNEGAEMSYQWTGSLTSGNSVNVTLPDMNITGTGNNEFSVRLALDTALAEYDYINNRRVARFNYRESVSLPFSEGFENGISDEIWYVDNPDVDDTWDTIATGGLSWSEFSAYMNFSTQVYNNRVDQLISPVIDISNADSLKLRFDVAYQYRHPILADTLKIRVSTDCGQNWSKVFEKGGEELGTTDDNDAFYVPQLPEDWREEIVDLAQFAGNSELMVSFWAKNRRGNYLNIDNISIYSGNPTSVAEYNNSHVQIFPNPAGEQLTIQYRQEHSEKVQIQLFNLLGERMLAETFTTANNGSKTVELSGLSSGVYLLNYCNDLGCRTFKVVRK